MHVAIQPIRVRSRRKVYLPHERVQVNGIGLGEVDGLFNIGKMFSRLTHFTPRSFQFKNIMGAVGSAAMFTGTMGLSSLAPKLTGAHSKLSKMVGMGVSAAALAAGAVVAAPALAAALPSMSTVGSFFSGAGFELVIFNNSDIFSKVNKKINQLSHHP